MAAGVLAPSITAIINKSIYWTCFPSQLKMAKIFPTHKSGPKSDHSNYRPISILPTISKLFERHINKHLMFFLNEYNLIHENKSGVRPKHSCQTALIRLVDQWMTCIDKVDIVGTLFIYFRKAFDFVDHSILLKKLYYKFNHSTFNPFASYIQNRMQVTDSGNGLTNQPTLNQECPRASSWALYYFCCLSMICICILSNVTQIIIQMMQRFTQAVKKICTSRYRVS